MIRQRFGCNNNPTVRQLTAAYKQIMLQLNMKIPKTANCVIQDNTRVLSLLVNKKPRKSIISNSADNVTPYNLPINISDELYEEFSTITETYFLAFYNNFSKVNENFSALHLDEIIEYIAGSIVNTISKKIKCGPCINRLFSTDKSKVLGLIKFKDQGGLKYPSNFVIKICNYAEQVIRTYKHLIFTMKNVISKLTIDAFNLLPLSFRELGDEHEDPLILLILKKYYVIRIHHECFLLLGNEERVRMLNNKLNLFRHQ